MSRYRGKHEFVVTIHIPCSKCGELKSEKEVLNRSRYAYGNKPGWVEINACCDPCFQKAFNERINAAKADYDVDSFGYYD